MGISAIKNKKMHTHIINWYSNCYIYIESVIFTGLIVIRFRLKAARRKAWAAFYFAKS